MQGALVDLGREGFVFDQLEELVFKYNGTFGGGDIFAYLEQAFIRHRHMALLDVVHQVLDALGNALAFGFEGFFLGLGIESQKIARRCSSHPLFHRKTNPAAGFGVCIHRLGQAHEGTGIEQVGGGIERRNRVAVPGLPREATVLDLQAVVQALVPQLRGVLEILHLQGLELVGMKLQLRHRRQVLGKATQIDGLEMLHGLCKTLAQVLLKSFTHLGPELRGGFHHVRLLSCHRVWIHCLCSVLDFIVTKITKVSETYLKKTCTSS